MSAVAYLRGRDGEVEIPVGPNLCFPRFARNEAEGLAMYRRWISEIARHRGNFLRLWLGHPFFECEEDACGHFGEGGLRRLRKVLDCAADHGVGVKVTCEFFRSLEERTVAEIFPGAPSFNRPWLLRSRGGVADDMDDYLSREIGRRHFLQKLDFLAAHLSAHPAIRTWELWNEMNAVHSTQWREWTETMLPELHRRFPGTHIVQSLGSHDRAERNDDYTWLAGVHGNDFLQVHRYVDEDAATWPVCHGPVDVMAASAVRHLRLLAPNRPIFLAESGMVEPAHTGPSRWYAKDSEGTILHDVLFAPFFAGAAGPGQTWHWDSYLDRHRLWWHFGVFQSAMFGIDFAAESFVPEFRESPDCRIYILNGRSTRLFWLRDATADWRSELKEGIPAAPGRMQQYPITSPIEGAAQWGAMDPWSRNGQWEPLTLTSEGVRLPAWRRSLLLRCRFPQSIQSAEPCIP